MRSLRRDLRDGLPWTGAVLRVLWVVLVSLAAEVPARAHLMLEAAVLPATGVLVLIAAVKVNVHAQSAACFLLVAWWSFSGHHSWPTTVFFVVTLGAAWLVGGWMTSVPLHSTMPWPSLRRLLLALTGFALACAAGTGLVLGGVWLRPDWGYLVLVALGALAALLVLAVQATWRPDYDE